MSRRLDLSIGQRLFLGFGVASVLLLALVAISRFMTQEVASIRHQQLAVIAPRAAAADRLESAVLYVAVTARQYVTWPALEHERAFDAALARMRVDVQALVATPADPDGAVLLAPLPEMTAAYERIVRDLVAAAAGGVPPDREAEGRLARAGAELLAVIHEYALLQQRKLDATRAEITRSVERLDRAVARLGLAALVIVALTGFLTSRSVRRPALRLVDAARSLAAGDFEPARGLGRHGAEGHRRDELTELSGAFRSMSIELKSREERLIRLNERIQAQQEELQAQFEELQSQHEELQAQGEELQSRNEELQAQAEELQAQDQELHRTVDRLAASEERYHGLFTHLSEAFALHELVYDESGRALDYRFLVANQAFEQATGLEASRVIGRTVRQVIPDIEAFWIERYAEVVRTRRPARFESFAAALGRHYQVVAFAVGVDRFATLFMDVTQQKRAEQALRQADRNKSDFIALLSHELRNPLASISNGVHVLGRAEPGSEEAEHARAVIARQVGQLTCLVEDLLDVERISRGKLELRRTALDLRHLVADIVDDCRASLVAAGVGLEVDLPAEPLHVNGDATRLSQVVGNLLQNAVKFTPSGGRVVVSLQVQDGSARLSVRDSGAGIEPHMLERLFQPFMQAKDGPARSKSGLGLGLALVKALVERHGGSVTASSEGPGRGSDFVVVLPLGSEESAIAEPRLEKSGGWARRRVLVIEDNVDAAESLRDLLVLEGHDVEIAHTGVEGVEKARACRPQVVLCDIGLPDVSGHEVAATFREDPLLQSVYLIALTGYALPEDIEKATAAGFDEHLPKPPAIERLHQILAALPPAGLPASDEA